MTSWLNESIFVADISWTDWRRYLGKPNRWIIDTAVERFRASLLPAQDWMQRGWVELYDDSTLGRGVRAVCGIPLHARKQRRLSTTEDLSVAADLSQFPQPQQSGNEVPWYRLEWSGGRQHLDAQQLWVGCINHLPMPHCNLKLTANGHLVQTKAITAGDALTFDYGVEWWAHRLTGVTWTDWMAGSASCRKGTTELFYRMHEKVLDYTMLLSRRWDVRLSGATSQLDREAVMMELWELLDERRTS